MSRSITVRIDERQFAALEEHAAKAGKKFSPFVRDIFDQAIARLTRVTYRVVDECPPTVEVGQLMRSHLGDSESAVWQVAEIVRTEGAKTTIYIGQSVTSARRTTQSSKMMDRVEGYVRA